MVSSLFCHHTEWKSLIPSPHRLHLTRYGLMVLWRWKDIHKFIVGNFKPLWSISSLWSLRVTLCNNTTTNSWMHVFRVSRFERNKHHITTTVYVFVCILVRVRMICMQTTRSRRYTNAVTRQISSRNYDSLNWGSSFSLYIHHRE